MNPALIAALSLQQSWSSVSTYSVAWWSGHLLGSVGYRLESPQAEENLTSRIPSSWAHALTTRLLHQT